jgi:transposase InsO family protein
MSWSVFLKAHWKARAASDFFTVEVWSWSGLVTYYVLFVMKLATRRVCIAGVTTHPDTQWMLQMARQLTAAVDGILLGKRYLILDRDTKYCQAFRDFVKREGIEVIRLPPRSPNLNAYAERWVGGVRDECLFEADPDWEGDAAACAARIPRPIFTMSGTTRV